MSTAYINHPDCLRHDMGPWHPECPARLMAIEDQLIASGLMPFLSHFEAPLATFEQISLVHKASYIQSIREASPEKGLTYLDPDTAMNPHTLHAALRAAGAVILAADLVLEGKVENAFCAVRPPGHHAESARAMGFCLFNNVAIGVAHVLKHHSLKRIAIADFDVHHGNGTEEIFRKNPNVMLLSTFQHPFYPYCGADSASEHIVNVPLAAGTGSDAFRQAVSEYWLPALDTFRPEMLFISAGFDAHREDEMANFNLTEDDYVWVTRQIKQAAEKHAKGRIVSALEGGYALHALGRSVAAHIKTLGDL